MSSRHDDHYRRRNHHDRRSRERRRSRSRDERKRSRSREERSRRDRDRSRDKNRDRSRERRERRRDERRRSRDRPQDKPRRESRKSPPPPATVPRERSKSIDKIISEDNSRSSAASEYVTEVLTEEQRQKVHEQTIARLEKLKKEQPKRLEPSRPSHATIFINDGSFLETFKQMQQQYQEQESTVVQPRPEEQLAQLPIYARRRGGKILKTGIVEKQKTSNSSEPAKDAWSLYLQEVKRYKNATCDADASRALVK